MMTGLVILIRHLPSIMSDEEKKQLLEYFGATEVRVMPCHGRFKHCAFATFPDGRSACIAIAQLHQKDIFDSVVSLEYAKNYDQNSAASESLTMKPNMANMNLEENRKECAYKEMPELTPIAPYLGIHYPANPGLRYRFPSATADIIHNISTTLKTNSKFYTQVLHLMNKMDLPAPFSRVNAQSNVVLKPLAEEPAKKKNEMISESESEYDSSSSEGRMIEEARLRALDVKVPHRVHKSKRRKTNHLMQPKKLKLVDLTAIPEARKSATKLTDAFDSVEIFAKKSIEILKIQASDEKKSHPEQSVTNTATPELGIIKSHTSGQSCDCQSEDLKSCISKKQLQAGRLSFSDLKSSPLFNGYYKGFPNSRLYVKNLSKHVTERDLQFIFGRFYGVDNESERDVCDIQLLKQGRMKGQAFIGFSSVEAASSALDATNGYNLLGRPMIVHFARSKNMK